MKQKPIGQEILISNQIHPWLQLKNIVQDESFSGILVASAIFILWVTSTLVMLALPLDQVSYFWIIIGILIRTFLHTGLFVVGHDAMHLNLAPNHRRLNHKLGEAAVSLYALIPYSKCCSNHRKHHGQPGQIGDPDFHDGVHTNPIRWYFKFIGEYFSFSQLIGFSLKIFILGFILLIAWGIHWQNFLLFLVLPLLLSSMQLFLFGTYLPHRDPQPNKKIKRQCSWIGNQIFWWSFFSCYHFGTYHEKHHAKPKTPWYMLPY